MLLLAVPFAYVAWTFGGLDALLAFAAPLALSGALIASFARRPGGR